MSSSFADIARGAGRSASAGRNVVDIITFAEAPWGLKMKLFPVQRVILKCHYGIELDDNPHGFDLSAPIPTNHPAYQPDLVDDDGYYHLTVPIWDWRREKCTYFTEAGYLRHLFKENRSNIEKVVPGEQRRIMVLSVGRRSGKCVEGDTLVLTDKGIYPIQDLGDVNGPEYQPLVIGVAQEKGNRSESAYFYNGGVQDTYHVQGYTGSLIKGTDKHRVKVLGENGVVEWCRLDDLRPGMFLAVDRGADLWSSEYVDVSKYHVAPRSPVAVTQPSLFDERLGLLMGYLVGDGNWKSKNAITITAEHPETKEEIDKLLLELFGRSSFSFDKRTAQTGQYRTFDVSLRDFFHNMGFRKDLTRTTKATPHVIFKSPRSVVKSYLQGLFETDGSVSKEGRVVSFSTASLQLAQETRLLLLNFGVVSRIRLLHRSNNLEHKDKTYYEVVVLGLRSRSQFFNEIGFRSQKKQNRLAGSFESSREGGDAESIPHQKMWVSRLLQSVPKHNRGKGWSRSTLRAVLGNVCKPGCAENMTYARIQTLLPIAKALGADPECIQHFEEIAAQDYFFDEVVSIEKGQAPVYDLTVPNGQSFVANGLVNHNTAMAACISAYETYKLISRGYPQAHYGMAPAANIQLISIATDKDQAGLLYQEVSGHFHGCTFFQPYMANNTQSYARFQTPKDIETGGSYQENPSAKATIKVTFRSCIAKGLRGAANIVVILDEVAHFTDDGQSSAQAVYDAIIPSTSTYYPKYPGTKKPIQPEKNDARIIMISSPLGCQGLFYKQFRIGMGDKGAEAAREMLSIQAPTWEVRPDIPAAEFIGRYAVDPKTFAVEYGAEFSNRTSGWIEDKRDLEACIKPDARPRYRSVPKLPHYVGLDFAQAGDGTAISIGHIEDGQVVLDLEDQIQANVGEYEDQSRLEFSEIVDWVYDFSKKFYIVDGIFDQWTGIAFEQALQARGLRQFRRFIATPQLNSDMYKNFKDMMYERKLSLYDWPIPPDKEHGPLIEELLELQATQKSKYVISVEAPKGMGKHDDRSDALVRMVWLASQQVASTPKVLAGASMNNRILPSGMPLAQRAIAQSIYQTQIKARQTGSSPERQVPRNGNSGKSFLAGGGLGRLGLGGPGFNGRGRGGGRR